MKTPGVFASVGVTLYLKTGDGHSGGLFLTGACDPNSGALRKTRRMSAHKSHDTRSREAIEPAMDVVYLPSSKFRTWEQNRMRMTLLAFLLVGAVAFAQSTGSSTSGTQSSTGSQAGQSSSQSNPQTQQPGQTGSQSQQPGAVGSSTSTNPSSSGTATPDTGAAGTNPSSSNPSTSNPPSSGNPGTAGDTSAGTSASSSNSSTSSGSNKSSNSKGGGEIALLTLLGSGLAYYGLRRRQ